MTPAEQLAWARQLVAAEGAGGRQLDHVVLDLIEGLNAATTALAVEVLALQMTIRDQ